MTCTPFNAAAAFDDLEDETFWADAPSENIQPFGSNPNVTEMPAGPQFKERCAKCGGTGTWRGGRMSGQCFACKGVGYKVFKTPPADRYKARTQAADRKVANLQAWQEANAAVVAWVRRRSTGDRPFDFAVSLAASLRQYGTLTDGQVAAVERQIERDVVRDAEYAAQRAAPRPSFVCEVAPVDEAFARAQAKGVKTPRMHLGQFVLRLKNGVMNVAHRERTEEGRFGPQAEWLGKLVDGRFQPGRACRPGEADALVAAFAALKDAGSLSALGQRTGICCACGLTLTVKASIDRGMGPICFGKYG